MYTTSVLYAVFTMIRSRPVSCTYCHIINLSITTITLCIAQKMQEAERIFNHHVYNVSAIRCIHDDSKSSCFVYLLSHIQLEYYHNHIMYCTENVCIVINLTIMISHAIIESCIFCYFFTCFCCLRYLVLGILGPQSPSISLIPCRHRESTEDEIHLHNQGCLYRLVNFMFEQFFQTFLKIRDKLLSLILTKTFQLLTFFHQEGAQARLSLHMSK